MASHDAAASFAIGMARHVPRCIRHQGYATKNYFDLWLRCGGLAQSYHLIETHLGITESVSLLVADAIEASQGLATILH